MLLVLSTCVKSSASNFPRTVNISNKFRFATVLEQVWLPAPNVTDPCVSFLLLYIKSWQIPLGKSTLQSGEVRTTAASHLLPPQVILYPKLITSYFPFMLILHPETTAHILKATLTTLCALACKIQLGLQGQHQSHSSPEHLVSHFPLSHLALI